MLCVEVDDLTDVHLLDCEAPPLYGGAITWAALQALNGDFSTRARFAQLVAKLVDDQFRRDAAKE